jgi:hypothetical protein
VEQEVVIDFVKQRITSFANTGVTVLKLIAPDGSVEYKQGKSSTDGIKVEDEVWNGETVSLTMRASASNPLRPDAPTVDYSLQINAHKDGTVQVKGSHDGFPCFEFYKWILGIFNSCIPMTFGRRVIRQLQWLGIWSIILKHENQRISSSS